MNEALMQRARELAARNYNLSIFNDEELDGQPVFLAKNHELYGCMAQGSTLDEAIENLKDARIDYIYSLLLDGLDVPNPSLELAPPVMTTETVDTTSPQVMIMKTIYFKEKTDSEPVAKKPLYEVSLA